ncbi:MAG: hypothetical protein KIT84_42730 [Labilithrix sp.]|nr:hypothetical protein [Labilithrix sp.]MCW5817794.1 hypothetical protein [Labilithrix sp.]
MTSRPAAVVAVFALVAGCGRAQVSASGSTDSAAQVEPAASSPPPAASSAAPAASVALDEAPDVRISLADQARGSVRVGQTLGILTPLPEDFLDEYVLAPGCSLGEPLTFISRGPIGRELLWKIDDERVGSHVVEVTLMTKKTRTSKASPSKRLRVLVDVTR